MRYTTKQERAFARQLRNNATPAEQLLWQYLKNKQTGFKITRQFTLFAEKSEGGEQKIILDFYCPMTRLAIEVDGGYHQTIPQQQKDEKRTNLLQQEKITVIRFPNEAVFENPQAVAEEIKTVLLTMDRFF